MPHTRFPWNGLVHRRIAASLAALVAITTFAIVPASTTPARSQVVDAPDPGSCSADILFILDSSGSMVSAGLNAVEAAVETFADELAVDPGLGGAPDSRIAAVHFSNGAAIGLGSYLNVVTDQATIDAYVSPGGAYRSYSHDWTNWQAAFETANTLPTPDFVFFLTDGQPTRTNATPGSGGNTNYDANAAAAVPAANALRAAVAGSATVIGIGVGSDFTNGQAANIARLESVTDSVTTSSFADLAESLALQINVLCAPSLTIEKIATPTSLTEPGGDFDLAVTITNTSASGADIRLTGLVDQVDGGPPMDVASIDGVSCRLDADSTPFDPTSDWLGAGASATCSWETTLTGPPGTTETDTVSASAVDPNGRTTGTVRDDATITVTDDPSELTITKNATPDTLAEPGGDVEYTIEVTNASAVDAITLETLVDDRFGDVTSSCTPTVAAVVLAAGETHTCTFTEAISIDGGGTHDNTIEITGIDDDGFTRTASAGASVTVVDARPSISLVKTAAPMSVTEPGDDVTFTVTVRNDSAVDTVTIDDLDDSEFADIASSCTPSFLGSQLEPGEDATCSFTAFIDAPHQNTATVEATSDDGDALTASDDARVGYIDTPATIRVTKAAAGGDVNVQAPGEEIEFEVAVANTSAVDSVTITSLVDRIDGGPEVDITSVAGPVLATTCSVPMVISAGDDESCSFRVFVGGSDGDSVTDEVTASGVSEDDQLVTAADTETVFVDNAWRIVAHKRICDSYDAIRSNENGSNLRQSILPLGSPVDGAGIPVNEAWEDANHDCAPVEGWPFTVGYGVRFPGESSYTGLADELSHVSDPEATAFTDADGRAVFALSAEQLETLILDQGELWIMEGRYEDGALVFPDDDAGFGILRCGTDVLNGDNAEVVEAADFANGDYTVTCFAYNVDERPDLMIDKEAVAIDGEAYADGDTAEAGETISYEITATNSGNVPLTGVTVVDDDLDGPLTCAWPGADGQLGVGDGSGTTIDDGDTVVCTGTHLVTQSDGEAGTFVNVATTDANEVEEPRTDDAEVPTTIPDDPSIDVQKVADPAVIDVSGTTTFTITITNDGNLTLDDLTIEDLLTYGTEGSERLESCEDPLDTTLAPGATTEILCTVELDVLVHGTDVLNTVSVVATATNGAEVSGRDDAPVTIVPPSAVGALTIEKLAGPVGTAPGSDAFVDVYDRGSDEGSVTWQVTIVNERPYALYDVTFTDVATPACETSFAGSFGADGGSATLEPGQVLVFTCDDALGIGVAKVNTAGVGAVDPWGQVVPTVEDQASTQSVAASATIGDTVWSDANANGIQDDGEPGIAGATVQLTLPDGTTTVATTNANGLYLFSALEAGTYTVQLLTDSIAAPTEGSLKLTTAGSFTVTLADGQSFLAADFGVTSTLPVTGLSSDRITAVGLVLLVLGAIALAATRRRRGEEDGAAGSRPTT